MNIWKYFYYVLKQCIAGTSIFFFTVNSMALARPVRFALCLPKSWRIGVYFTLHMRHDLPFLLCNNSWRQKYLTLGTRHAIYSKIRQEIINTVLHLPSIFSPSKHLQKSAYAMCHGPCSCWDLFWFGMINSYGFILTGSYGALGPYGNTKTFLSSYSSQLGQLPLL